MLSTRKFYKKERKEFKTKCLLILLAIHFLQCSPISDDSDFNKKSQIIEKIESISIQSKVNQELLLFQKAIFLNSVNISEDEFSINKSFYVSLDFKLINSENYGILIIYNGKECKELLNKYTKSVFFDDCTYLLHNIENEKKDFLILKKELNFLKDFLVQFPSTNLKIEILERIKIIEEEIKSGVDIID
ncbi:hypothetical protein [Leptospira vanthielii]|uniref:Lipoprotein n=1 Tax=Leptospira vanthielii TaxID=293085 RepID=A0ABY2NUR5_9LEPT|nr:hypothetical protein [Leptospira vanthielii]TGM61730.1 hypothetical protein EHQ95_00330 [Leptospira vanthielii]